MEQVLKDKVSQLIPRAENLWTNPLPDIVWGHLDHLGWEVKQKRENGEHPIHWSEIDLKDVTGEENQEIARQLWEERKQMKSL